MPDAGNGKEEAAVMAPPSEPMEVEFGGSECVTANALQDGAAEPPPASPNVQSEERFNNDDELLDFLKQPEVDNEPEVTAQDQDDLGDLFGPSDDDESAHGLFSEGNEGEPPAKSRRTEDGANKITKQSSAPKKEKKKDGDALLHLLTASVCTCELCGCKSSEALREACFLFACRVHFQRNKDLLQDGFCT